METKEQKNKNKGKKAYLTFMTLALAITMFISSSITLAFFGSSAKGSATIKMGNAVEVDSATIVESPQLYVYPSQMVDIDATATVKSPGQEGGETDAILRAKVNSSTGLTSVAVVSEVTVNGKKAYWKDNGDGYIYLVTEKNGNVLFTIETTLTGVEVPMQISVMVPSDLDNDDAGTQYTVVLVFCAVQARIYDNTGLTVITNTIDSTKSIFDQVEGVAVQAGGLKRIVGNSVQYGTPTPNSPSEIQSVGDRTKNLYNKATITEGKNLNANTGALYNSETRSVSDYIPIVAGQTYHVDYGAGYQSYINQGSSPYGTLYNSDFTFSSEIKTTRTTTGFYFTPAITGYARVNCYIGMEDYLQVELGSTATSYEPYGYKIPVKVDNVQYNIYLDEPLRKVGNYADYIDFETSQVVRQVKKSEINGDSIFGKFSNVTTYSAFYMDFSADMITYAQNGKVDLEVLSNKFEYHNCGGANVNTSWTNQYQLGGSLASTYTRICFTLPNTITDTASAKLWLRDNPISIYYPLATPISTNIDLDHIPNDTDAVYSVPTQIQATIIVNE